MQLLGMNVCSHCSERIKINLCGLWVMIILESEGEEGWCVYLFISISIMKLPWGRSRTAGGVCFLITGSHFYVAAWKTQGRMQVNLVLAAVLGQVVSPL